MSLQFADFDADGIRDIVTATWEGMPFLVKGTKQGFAAPEYIRDRDEQLIVTTRWYDVKGRKYVNESSDNHLISAMVFDWDADGDLDMIVGSKDGKVYLRKNEGTRKAPAFSTKNVQLRAGGQPFKVPGGSTAPRLCDWDGDGLKDLICGSFKGGAYLYRNTGKAGAPVFAAGVELIAAPSGRAAEGESRPESGWYVDPVDYDGDGHLDLVVGAQFMSQPKARQLTAKEVARTREIDATLRDLNKEWSAGYAKVREATKDDTDAFQKAFHAWTKEPAVRKLSKHRSELSRELAKLRPRPRRDSGVWVYRQLRAE